MQRGSGEWIVEPNETRNGQHSRSASFPGGIAEGLHVEK